MRAVVRTTVTVSCECGTSVDFPTALREDQTLIHNRALAQTLLDSFDAAHVCPTDDEPESLSCVRGVA